MVTLAGTRLYMYLKPQQRAEMNTPHSKQKNSIEFAPGQGGEEEENEDEAD